MNCCGASFGHARLDALPDRLRGTHGNLLADDRTRERGERIVAIDQMHGPELRNQFLEDAVALDEIGARLVPVLGTRDFGREPGDLDRHRACSRDRARLAHDLAFVLRVAHERLRRCAVAFARCGLAVAAVAAVAFGARPFSRCRHLRASLVRDPQRRCGGRSASARRLGPSSSWSCARCHAPLHSLPSRRDFAGARRVLFVTSAALTADAARLAGAFLAVAIMPPAW